MMKRVVFHILKIFLPERIKKGKEEVAPQISGEVKKKSGTTSFMGAGG
ncbi:MAG TPA: hypothetical protein HA258_05780 [Thermoplasmata archaeon]|jgi:hypothetical protein|nr:hypothetical protein [Thermoplasmata archaeon]HIH28837.1 hypothetical protein [Thermoplasmata archaeon]